MNPITEDIKDMLVAESSLGLVFGTNLFIGREPDAPDNCVTIFDTVVAEPVLTLDKRTIERPSFQIRVRNNSYLNGYATIRSIADTLHSRAHEIWSGTLYMVIYILNGPNMLDWDENNRVRFIVNFNTQRIGGLL